MHFIAMLTFVMPMPVSYDFGLTLLSLLVAIAFTGLGFFMIGTRRAIALQLVLSGILMGVGIISMHYTGMAAMRMPPARSPCRFLSRSERRSLLCGWRSGLP
jgi:NO-binding membrane sensor protein with MHYT domain